MGGTFINPGWVAFNGDQMEVQGGVFQGCVFQSREEYSGDPNERFDIMMKKIFIA